MWQAHQREGGKQGRGNLFVGEREKKISVMEYEYERGKFTLCESKPAPPQGEMLEKCDILHLHLRR